VKACAYVHGDGRNLIPHLGPSFGTKVLCFSGYGRSHGDLQPLIVDQYVALNRLCRLDWPAHGWTTAQYAEYLGLAHSWANAWHTSPDVIERVLFSAGKASPARRRRFHRAAASWVAADTPLLPYGTENTPPEDKTIFIHYFDPSSDPPARTAQLVVDLHIQCGDEGLDVVGHTPATRPSPLASPEALGLTRLG
jgi:Putative 8-oxoguanine DNA glycosylase OGG-like protein